MIKLGFRNKDEPKQKVDLSNLPSSTHQPAKSRCEDDHIPENGRAVDTITAGEAKRPGDDGGERECRTNTSLSSVTVSSCCRAEKKKRKTFLSLCATP